MSLVMRIIRLIAFLLSALSACLTVTATQALDLPPGTPQTFGLDAPLDVAVGIKIDQITFVDQKSENYGAVATIRLEWQDPQLAFDADDSNSEALIMPPAEFAAFVRSKGALVPAFEIANQQSRKWEHQALAVIWPTGRVRYYEKSSLTLQAPYFNFTRYPFDHQKFYLEVVSLYPDRLVSYSVLDDLSGLGGLLGEEEWILENPRMELSLVEGLSGQPSAKVALAFEGRRHVMYYALRIFLPMLVLVTVSWAIFFLNEYRKRAEIAGGNLLVFVAFNWAVSEDLPRLGYLTFLDFLLQWMFVVTGAVIVFNIMLSRIKASGRGDFAHRLDTYAIMWIYPLGYLAIVALAVDRYLLHG